MKKITSIVVLLSFIYSFVIHEPVFGIINKVKRINQTPNLLEEKSRFFLPLEYGRIVDYSYNSDATLFIFIHDLHCNSEAQRNIFNIINFLNSKCQIEKFFVEGAPFGRVNFDILESIPIEIVRKRVLDYLLSNGFLSAIEYFSVIKGQKNVCGMEDWSVYKENLDRMKILIKNKESNNEIVSQLERKICQLKKNYLSRNTKKMLSMLNNVYCSDREKSKNLFFKYEKYLKKYGIKIKYYPNIVMHLEMLKNNRRINFSKIPLELKQYLGFLKKIIPDKKFNYIINKFSNFNDASESLIVLSKIAYELGLLSFSNFYEKSFKTTTNLIIDKKLIKKNIRFNNFNSFKLPKNLRLLLEITLLNYLINPFNLVSEEQTIKREMTNNYITKLIDKEIVFLSNMTQSFKNFINLKMTKDEYLYFKENIPKYKSLLKKYLSNAMMQNFNNSKKNNLFPEKFKRVILDKEKGEILSRIFSLIENLEYFNFYEINIQRNKIFEVVLKNDIFENDSKILTNKNNIKNISKHFENNNSNSKINSDSSICLGSNINKCLFNYFDDEYCKILKNLSSFSKVYIVISGGFHLDIVNSLSKTGASYLTVIPNVTRNFNSVYEKVIANNLDINDYFVSSLSPALDRLSLNKEEIISQIEILAQVIASFCINSDISLEGIGYCLQQWLDKVKNICHEYGKNISNELDLRIFKVNNRKFKLVIFNKSIRKKTTIILEKNKLPEIVSEISSVYSDTSYHIQFFVYDLIEDLGLDNLNFEDVLSIIFKDKRVLDAGCGLNMLQENLSLLSRNILNETNVFVIGIDPYVDGLPEKNKIGLQELGKLKLENDSYARKYFDIVTIIRVFESSLFLRQKNKEILEKISYGLNEVIADGGFIIVIDEHPEILKDYLKKYGFRHAKVGFQSSIYFRGENSIINKLKLVNMEKATVSKNSLKDKFIKLCSYVMIIPKYLLFIVDTRVVTWKNVLSFINKQIINIINEFNTIIVFSKKIVNFAYLKLLVIFLLVNYFFLADSTSVFGVLIKNVLFFNFKLIFSLSFLSLSLLAVTITTPKDDLLEINFEDMIKDPIEFQKFLFDLIIVNQFQFLVKKPDLFSYEFLEENIIKLKRFRPDLSDFQVLRLANDIKSEKKGVNFDEIFYVLKSENKDLLKKILFSKEYFTYINKTFENIKNIYSNSENYINLLEQLLLIVIYYGYLNRVNKSITDIWFLIFEIMKIRKDLNFISSKGFQFKYILRLLNCLLAEKAERLDRKKIENSYIEYFNVSKIPKKNNHPKVLIAYIILDATLELFNIRDRCFINFFREKYFPQHTELLAVIKTLLEGDNFVLSLINEFNVINNESNLMQSIKNNCLNIITETIFVYVINRKIYEELNLIDIVEIVISNDIRKLLKEENLDEVLLNRLKTLKKIVPEKIASLLGYENIETYSFLDERELSVLSFFSRNYISLNDYLLKIVRKYFASRFSGNSKVESSHRANRVAVEMFHAKKDIFDCDGLWWKDFVKNYFDESLFSVKNPFTNREKFTREVESRQYIRTNKFLFQSVMEIATNIAEIDGEEESEELKFLIRSLNSSNLPSSFELREILANITQRRIFLERNLKDKHLIFQFKSVELKLMDLINQLEKKSNENYQSCYTNTKSKLVEVYIESNLVEKILLGTDLDGSCLDIRKGNASDCCLGYITSPLVNVVYFRDALDINKPPIARFSVMFDPIDKLLVPISDIYTSTDLDFYKTACEFLKFWADYLKVDVFLPFQFGRDVGIYFHPQEDYILKKKTIFLPANILVFYSDLSRRVNPGENKTMTLYGWFYESKKEKSNITENMCNQDIFKLALENLKMSNIFRVCFNISRKISRVETRRWNDSFMVVFDYNNSSDLMCEKLFSYGQNIINIKYIDKQPDEFCYKSIFTFEYDGLQFNFDVYVSEVKQGQKNNKLCEILLVPEINISELVKQRSILFLIQEFREGKIGKELQKFGLDVSNISVLHLGIDNLLAHPKAVEDEMRCYFEKNNLVISVELTTSLSDNKNKSEEKRQLHIKKDLFIKLVGFCDLIFFTGERMESLMNRIDLTKSQIEKLRTVCNFVEWKNKEYAAKKYIEIWRSEFNKMFTRIKETEQRFAIQKPKISFCINAPIQDLSDISDFIYKEDKFEIVIVSKMLKFENGVIILSKDFKQKLNEIKNKGKKIIVEIDLDSNIDIKLFFNSIKLFLEKYIKDNLDGICFNFGSGLWLNHSNQVIYYCKELNKGLLNGKKLMLILNEELGNIESEKKKIEGIKNEDIIVIQNLNNLNEENLFGNAIQLNIDLDNYDEYRTASLVNEVFEKTQVEYFILKVDQIKNVFKHTKFKISDKFKTVKEKVLSIINIVKKAEDETISSYYLKGRQEAHKMKLTEEQKIKLLKKARIKDTMNKNNFLSSDLPLIHSLIKEFHFIKNRNIKEVKKEISNLFSKVMLVEQYLGLCLELDNDFVERDENYHKITAKYVGFIEALLEDTLYEYYIKKKYGNENVNVDFLHQQVIKRLLLQIDQGIIRDENGRIVCLGINEDNRKKYALLLNLLGYDEINEYLLSLGSEIPKDIELELLKEFNIYETINNNVYINLLKILKEIKSSRQENAKVSYELIKKNLQNYISLILKFGFLPKIIPDRLNNIESDSCSAALLLFLLEIVLKKEVEYKEMKESIINLDIRILQSILGAA